MTARMHGDLAGYQRHLRNHEVPCLECKRANAAKQQDGDQVEAFRRVFAPVPQWTEQALCAQADPDEWFPPKGGSSEVAKAICGQCPVQAECLQYALDNHERFGIFGGLSERERRRLQKGAAA